MDIVESIKKTAKEILSEFKSIEPIVFFIKDELIHKVSPFSEVIKLAPNLAEKYNKTSNIKDVGMMVVGALSKIEKYDSVIIVQDAAMRTVEKEDVLDITSGPLTYPKSMRKECIIIMDVKFNPIDSKVIAIPYKGGDGENVEFIDEEMVMSGNDFDSRLVDAVVFGYNKIQSCIGE